MTQYVLQIEKDIVEGSVIKGTLSKSYEVTEDRPIRPPEQVPETRIQLVITDKALFDKAVAVYDRNKKAVQYTWADPDLSWEVI